MRNPYTVLGVAQDASPEEIRARYRALAQQLHPDREDGSEEAFKELGEAFSLLSDAGRRARFDVTGLTSSPKTKTRDLQAEALEQLGKLLNEVLSEADPDERNIQRLMDNQLRDALREAVLQKAKGVKKLARAKRAAARFSGSMSAVSEGLARNMEEGLGKAQDVIDLMERMRSILKEGKYDSPPEATGSVETVFREP